MLLTELLQITDNGPIYAETLIGKRPFVEPWNSLSSLFIAGAGAVFLFKIRKGEPGYGFILFSAIMLLIGGIGSTLFHGLRTSRWLVVMDFLPIIIVSLTVGLVFWKRVVHNWLLATVIIVALMALRLSLYQQQNTLKITGQGLINISYFISGITIFLPCLIFLVRTRFFKSNYLFASLGLMILALVFRTIDKEVTDIIPIGTHFLWHVASGLGAYFMGLYIVATEYLEYKKP
jgi:hypothetical protein